MQNQWDVRLTFEEDGDRTVCEAVLVGTRAPELRARGESVRSLRDRPEPRIGEEVAASRALSSLQRRLMAQASGDIEDCTRRPARLFA
jgi:hypothetical protein